jgi:hypothetical protein
MLYYNTCSGVQSAGMVELVYTLVLGTNAARLGSSSLPPSTLDIRWSKEQIAPIAQLVEQLPLKETVVGSNPSGAKKKKKACII